MGNVLASIYLACTTRPSGRTARPTTGRPASLQALNPPSSGRTRWNPKFFICSATRALVASAGHVHTRTNSRVSGRFFAYCSMSSGRILRAPGIVRGSARTSSG